MWQICEFAAFFLYHGCLESMDWAEIVRIALKLNVVIDIHVIGLDLVGPFPAGSAVYCPDVGTFIGRILIFKERAIAATAGAYVERHKSLSTTNMFYRTGLRRDRTQDTEARDKGFSPVLC